jgi:error-prone DNA polymerase
MTALALTDRDTVTGTVRFAQGAAPPGPAVLGVDLAVEALAPPTPAVGVAHPGTRRRARGRAAAAVRAARADREGWARLCRLVSAAHAGPSGAAPVVSWEALREYAGPDLTVLLGPPPNRCGLCLPGRPDVAEKLLAPWRELFGTGLRLEP